MSRVLVTGGLGYVGSRLVPHLLSLGHEVSVLDLLLYGDAGLAALQNNARWSEWSPRFELRRGDIRHPHAVLEAIAGCDAVIHLAAISNDPTGEIDEVLTRQVNFDAVGQLVAIARESGVRRVINASSSSVFGARAESEIDESLEPEPLTVYSKYKALSEWIVLAAASRDLCAVNIRPATICGHSPRQRFDLTVNKLTADAIRKGVITVHGGTQRRPNVGMADMIHLYARLLDIPPEKINGRTFNFGFENHRVLDIARIIRSELADLDIEIRVTETTDHRDYHISSRRILAGLNYSPVSDIRAEVASLRAALEAGLFPDIDAPVFHNMKSMVLGRDAGCTGFLARA
ncbi:MAG: NAD-dependent epimerase/dehydratase family protein [Verrucomicrobiota bacterium]